MRRSELRALEIAEEGLVDAVNENCKEAIKTLNKALVLNGEDPDILEALGLVYNQDKQYDKSSECFSSLLKKYPDNLNARNNLAGVYIDQKKFNLAKKELEKILDKEEHIRARGNLGKCYTGLGDLDSAIKEYSLVVEKGIQNKINLGWRHLFTTEGKLKRGEEFGERRMDKIIIQSAYTGLLKAYHSKEDNKKFFKTLFDNISFRFKTYLADFLYKLKP